MNNCWIALSGLLLLGGHALAETPIHESRAVNADARIEVSNVKGSVTVSGWDRAEVAISGTLGDGAKGLRVEGGGDHLLIKVDAPAAQGGWFSWGADTHMGDTRLDIKVPVAATMAINVVSADVTLTGVAGRSLDIDSVSGKLHLDSGAQAVEVDSVSGNIDLVGKAERAHLQSVSGNIRARGLGGTLKFESVSGDISADNGSYGEIDASTVSGGIDLRGDPARAARIGAKSMSGDIRLVLPADVSTRLRASTFSGDIRSDFGTVKEPDHGPGNSLDASTGAGDGQIKLETFSGDVEVRRQ